MWPDLEALWEDTCLPGTDTYAQHTKKVQILCWKSKKKNKKNQNLYRWQEIKWYKAHFKRRDETQDRTTGEVSLTLRFQVSLTVKISKSAIVFGKCLGTLQKE